MVENERLCVRCSRYTYIRMNLEDIVNHINSKP